MRKREVRNQEAGSSPTCLTLKPTRYFTVDALPLKVRSFKCEERFYIAEFSLGA